MAASFNLAQPCLNQSGLSQRLRTPPPLLPLVLLSSDLKELLPILDRYVLACIIASHATLYTDLTHDQALFPLLRALAQTIVNIINPQASLNTRPVLPTEIYKVEFWHAHLNYACLRASDAGLPGGGAASLTGDQLCHWNTLSPDAVFQATHLIVFLPPCLGAFVLSNHSSHNSTFFKFSSPDAPTNESPTACVKQVANFPLPSLLPNQSDTLLRARAAATEGYLSTFTIPLLAQPETLVQPARLNWVPCFPLPPPNPLSSRRFSSTPSYHYGPRTPQALDAASTPPRHEYILDGTWRSHRNLPCGLSLQVYIQFPLITFGFNL